MKTPLALAALVATFSVVAPASAEVIKDIVVQENTKTRTETVVLIAGIERGDDFTPESLERIRADLVNSGLFKDVEVFSAPVPGGIQVVIVARDKHSWVIAPTFYNQPTNKGGGIGFGENNLFGENKKLLLYGQVATGDSFFVGAYVDPSIRGTRFRWALDVFLKSERTIEYSIPTDYVDDPAPLRRSRLNYLNSGARLGVTLFRGATLDARLRGAHVSYGDTTLDPTATIEQITGDPASLSVPDPGVEGWDVSTEVIIAIDRRANWYGISHGDKYQLNFEHSLKALGSDFDYWYATASVERARKYFERHNLVIRARAGLGKDLPFQQEFLAGGTTLRGFKNSQMRGDFKASANIEYSVPFINIKGLAMRMLAFVDTSYTAFLDVSATDAHRHYLPGTDRLGLAPFKNSIGVGTRLYIRQIVLPLLGLDLGYSPERRAAEIYLAIGLTD